MDGEALSASREKSLGTDKTKRAKSRLRGQKLPAVETTSMIKGPGHVSSFKPLLQPGKKKD
jgi:hypothetical protein